MAAIAPNWRTLPHAIVCTLLAAILPASAKPRADDLRSTLTYFCSALANGNPTDAMSTVSKSYVRYSELSDRLSALTASYDIATEVEVNDEVETQVEGNLSVAFTLVLTDRATGESKRRTRSLEIRFRRESGKWKIATMDGGGLFSP